RAQHRLCRALPDRHRAEPARRLRGLADQVGALAVAAAHTYRSAEAATPRPMAMLWLAVALLAAFVLMAVAVAVNPSAPFTQGLDDWWRGIIAQSPDDTLYRSPFAMFFQDLGQ